MPNPVFYDNKYWWFNLDGKLGGPYASAEDAWEAFRLYGEEKYPNRKFTSYDD